MTNLCYVATIGLEFDEKSSKSEFSEVLKMDVIKEFYSTADESCCFISESEITDDSIPVLMELLMKLYISAVNLPEIEPETIVEYSTEETEFPSVRVSSQIPQFYWEVFDPLKKDDLVCGDLIDDLSDISIDLKSGITEYEAGRIGNAVFEWRFGLDNHWGMHAVDLLRALHAIRTR